MNMNCATIAVIPAAGSSTRFGTPLPKQYQMLAGCTVIEHAVRALAKHPAIEAVYVVLAADDQRFAACDWSAVKPPVRPLYCGGPSRAASVFNGLMAINGCMDSNDWVLVHDAARPCLSLRELERLFDELLADDVGGLLALPVTDTLKQADASTRVNATVARDGLWRALTPQMFRYRLLVEALHRSLQAPVTDEASAIERLGLKPRLVEGAATNIKVTFPEDLMLAQAILSRGGA
jgi:2-C-methyl-D-erythritol 4-phosphate cytidylyltransferase